MNLGKGRLLLSRSSSVAKSIEGLAAIGVSAKEALDMIDSSRMSVMYILALTHAKYAASSVAADLATQ
jgi:hypothetical protein